jgi:hypothetical protein
MNAIQYTRKLRRLGVISMLIVGITAACMVSFGEIPDEDYVPYVAVLIGFVPMILFIMKNKPMCEKCQGMMKFKAGFPTIVYRCKDCGDIVDTGIHPVY